MHRPPPESLEPRGEFVGTLKEGDKALPELGIKEPRHADEG